MRMLRARSGHLTLVVLLALHGPRLALASTGPSAASPLCRYPDVSRTQIVFVHGGDLWLVSRQGGVASRLTTDGAPKRYPRFSPDGSQIAYTGRFSALYTIAAAGGAASRVTHFTGSTELCDWTTKNGLLFATNAFEDVLAWRARQLFEVSPRGGLPTRLPVPSGADASIDDDGRWLAYTPTESQLELRKHYRGGFAPDIWLFDLQTHRSKRMTTWRGTDAMPMWHGATVYFLSDSGSTSRLNLWSYDTRTGRRRQLTHFTDFDVRWPAMGPGEHGEGEIAFQCGPDLYLLDLADTSPRSIPVVLPASPVGVSVDPSRNVEAVVPSPHGDRLAVEARGDLWIVTADSTGSSEPLTSTSGVRERDPSWSPDGRSIAYFADTTGEYELWVRSVDDHGTMRRLTNLGAGFPSGPIWSPDSRYIAFHDQSGRIYVHSLADQSTTVIARDSLAGPPDLAWSPDSRWLAYTQAGSNHPRNRVIWIHSLDTGRDRQVTSGWADDFSPTFDRLGQYLYWVSKRAFREPVFDTIDYDDFIFPESEVILCAPLRPALGAPWAPRAARDSAPARDTLVLDGVEQRAIAVTPESGRFTHPCVDADGSLVYGWTPARGDPAVKMLDFAAWRDRRKPPAPETLVAGIADVRMSADGHMLFARRDSMIEVISLPAAPPRVRHVPLRMRSTVVDLASERRQIFADVWRIYRDFYYDPNMSGVDWLAQRRRYEPFLEGCGDRDDLDYVLGEMLSELGASHVTVTPPPDSVGPERVGMLGVDFSIDHGAYRIDRIHDSGAADVLARNPLRRPGVDVREGDYLLKVNGRPLAVTEDPWAAFVGTAGRPVTLTVGHSPSADSTRDVRVVPGGDDNYYRNRAWIEHSRVHVEQRGHGRIGYIYLSDTFNYGAEEWVRQLYPQLDKDALIIDVRWNEGGRIPDKFIQMLAAIPGVRSSQGSARPHRTPEFGHVGPQCVLINGMALSGGDWFPYLFRKSGMGQLIGTTTMGSLLGAGGVAPDLIDGGRCDPPHIGFTDEHGWAIEGSGVQPDISVNDDPTLGASGVDVQLDAAIAEMLRELDQKPHSHRWAAGSSRR
jgi:tricorn protease